MRTPRLSIAGLMAVIGLVAVGFAALRAPSPLWANVLFSLAVATLTVAILAAVYRRGRRRAFWVGFASCGWVYLILALGPGQASQASPYLVTTAVLDILYPLVVPPPAPSPAMGGVMDGSGGMPGMMDPGMMAGGMMPGAGASAGGSAPPPSPTRWETWTETDQYPDLPLGGAGRFLVISPAAFRRIGHSLCSLLFAVLGGFLTRHFHSTRDEPR